MGWWWGWWWVGLCGWWWGWWLGWWWVGGVVGGGVRRITILYYLLSIETLSTVPEQIFTIIWSTALCYRTSRKKSWMILD